MRRDSLAVAGLLALLSACGGGGGSPTAPATPVPTPTPGPLYTEVAPLRDAAASAGKLVGAAVYSSGLASGATYAGAAGRHFNYLTAEYEMKWDPIQRNPGVYDLVEDLKERGLVDGVGLQMHISAASFPPVADIAANINRLADLGLKVNISEMDVRVRDVAGDAATKLQRQRQVYRDVVAACVAQSRCEAVTFWGFTDAHSWIDGVFGADDPLLFDDQYRAKPAFFGVEDADLRR